MDGDFVLVSKIPILLDKLSTGDLVVFRQPGYGILIKRVEWRSPDGQFFYATGLHPNSVDSREFGPVKREALLGKVLFQVKKKA